MNNFIVGQFGYFDEEKFKKDYVDGIWGIEACMFENQENIDELLNCCVTYDLKLGVHFPLRKGVWDHRDPQYMSSDFDREKASYNYMLTEMDYLETIQPDYVLIHYPKPVVLDTKTDWFSWGWRFYHDSEYVMMDTCDEADFKEKSESFFKWFASEAKSRGFKAVVELDNIPPYLYETTLLEELLEKYDIDLCVDIGRLHLQDRIDDHFDALSYLKRIVKYIKEVHLWNIQVEDVVSHSHFPALPTLKKEDGWADIEAYFSILNEGYDYKILFEHQSMAITDQEMQHLYQWIQSLYHRRLIENN